MKSYKIGVVAGDGIGPEVVREGLKVLKAVAAVEHFTYELVEYPWGSERYLKTGEACPPNVLDEYRKLDAILLGAIGDPRCPTGVVEHAVIMTMRVGLDLYVNLRPITLYAEHLCPLKNKKPEDVDMLVCRENTEDAYTGPWGLTKKGTPDEIATALMLYTRKGTERIIRYAFEACRARNKRKKVTLVDKANAVRAHDLWTRTFEEVGREYPDIEKDHAYVDATCMWFVKNPEWFDVIVTTNLFGDIITDLGAMIQGGMGIAASGNIHPGQVSMFEPIHGSAPKYAGKNVANPLATINAVAMMLDFLGEKNAATWIDQAVRTLLVSRCIPSVEARSGLSTSEIGDLVAQQVS
jgi:3-isopropylmalate dehydrogenase